MSLFGWIAPSDRTTEQHDAHAAAYADRVLFLADGRLVAETRNPTAESVLDTMKQLDRRSPRPAVA